MQTTQTGRFPVRYAEAPAPRTDAAAEDSSFVEPPSLIAIVGGLILTFALSAMTLAGIEALGI